MLYPMAFPTSDGQTMTHGWRAPATRADGRVIQQFQAEGPGERLPQWGPGTQWGSGCPVCGAEFVEHEVTVNGFTSSRYAANHCPQLHRDYRFPVTARSEPTGPEARAALERERRFDPLAGR